MPVQNGSDSKGKFYRWGKSGKKYYYSDGVSETRAKNKALKQGRAIKASE